MAIYGRLTICERAYLQRLENHLDAKWIKTGRGFKTEYNEGYTEVEEIDGERPVYRATLYREYDDGQTELVLEVEENVGGLVHCLYRESQQQMSSSLDGLNRTPRASRAEQLKTEK